MHIIFYCILVNPTNSKQLKDPRKELEILFIFIFEFSQIWKDDHFDFNIFSLWNISNIKNKWEKIIWLLQIKRNIGVRNLKSNYDFSDILFELEKYAFFENYIFRPENVHFVLNILFRRRKLFMAFLDFLIFY